MIPVIAFLCVVEKIAAWSSILGLCISVITLIIAGSVNRAVQETNKKVLLRHKLSEDLECLQDSNSTFVQLISDSNKDRIKIHNVLSKISSRVRIIDRYIPREFVRSGNGLIRSISSLRRGQMTVDALWDIYRNSVGFVDELSNYSREADFIS